MLISAVVAAAAAAHSVWRQQTVGSGIFGALRNECCWQNGVTCSSSTCTKNLRHIVLHELSQTALMLVQVRSDANPMVHFWPSLTQLLLRSHSFILCWHEGQPSKPNWREGTSMKMCMLMILDVLFSFELSKVHTWSLHETQENLCCERNKVIEHCCGLRDAK